MIKSIPKELKTRFNTEKMKVYMSSRINDIQNMYKKEKSDIKWKYESENPVQSHALILSLLEINHKFLLKYGNLKITAMMFGLEKNKVIDNSIKSQLENVLVRDIGNINRRHESDLEMISKKYGNNDWTMLKMPLKTNSKFSVTYNILLNKLREAIYNFNEESNQTMHLHNPSTKYKPIRKDYYINPERIDKIKNINSNKFNFQKLIELCEEINKCYSLELNYALLSLQRALIDHIHPIYGKESFKDYWNSLKYSEKKLYEKLDIGLKKIADIALHQEIRKKRIETPPLDQIDFRPQIDKLLGDIIVELESMCNE